MKLVRLFVIAICCLCSACAAYRPTQPPAQQAYLKSRDVTIDKRRWSLLCSNVDGKMVSDVAMWGTMAKEQPVDSGGT